MCHTRQSCNLEFGGNKLFSEVFHSSLETAYFIIFRAFAQTSSMALSNMDAQTIEVAASGNIVFVCAADAGIRYGSFCEYEVRC